MNKSELQNTIETKQKELKNLFDSHKDANGEFQMSSDVIAEAEQRETELSELNSKLFDIKKLESIQKNNQDYFADSAKAVNRIPFDANNVPEVAYKSLATQIIESGALKSVNGPSVVLPNVDFKTVMSTGAGAAPDNGRAPGFVLSPQRPLSVLDYMPVINTNQSAYKFLLETTFTNNAAGTAESVEGTLASYPESALAYTETTALIEKIATFLPVSDEQLADVPGIQELIEQRLGYMVKAAFESQIIAGNGTPPNLRGLINTSGVNTQAKGSDSVPDAIYKGITLIRVNGQTEPNLVLMHPSDWQDIRILQNTTGQYLWESPAVAGARTLFGLPVVLSTAVTQNTAVLLDTFYTQVVMRRGVDIQLSNSHGSYFTAGVTAIRADLRGGLAVLRPKAVCTVTGI